MTETEGTIETQPDTVATHLGEVVSGKRDRGGAAERPQLHGSARDSTGRQPGHDAHAHFRHHGGSNRNHQSFGRFESRKRFDRWPARIGERFHGKCRSTCRNT